MPSLQQRCPMHLPPTRARARYLHFSICREPAQEMLLPNYLHRRSQRLPTGCLRGSKRNYSLHTPRKSCWGAIPGSPPGAHSALCPENG